MKIYDERAGEQRHLRIEKLKIAFEIRKS